MTGIFLKLVNLSITASWLILAVMLFRVIMKKAPKWIHCAMWGLVGIRLVFPFSWESIFSLIPSAETFEPEMLGSRQFEINSGIEVLDTPVNDYMASHYYEGVTAPANFKVDVTGVLAVVWLIGVAVMLGYAFYSYRKLKKELKTATLWEEDHRNAGLPEDESARNTRCEENKDEQVAYSQTSRKYKIRQSEKAGSPFVLGLLRPVIYLPYDMNETDRAYVIAHEEAHIKRKDHWIKPIGFLILSVYWFHPLLWLAYVMLCKDIELACDEKVIRSLGYDERQDYSLALLNCSINRYRIAACPLAFGEVSVKERVKSVMHYKKPGFWVLIASAVACVIVAVCFLTDPAHKELYAPEPFCHSYRVEEVVYDAPQYSFTYTPETAPKYSLTSDYAFMKQQANGGNWEQIYGGFDEVKLTKDNFDALFTHVDNVSGFSSIEVSPNAAVMQEKQLTKLRKENKKAWRLDVTGESGGMNTEYVFYYLMLQENGDVYLSYGYDFTDRKEEGLSNEPLIRWLFKLNLREEVGISINTTGMRYTWLTSGGDVATSGELLSAGTSGSEGINGWEEAEGADYYFTAQVDDTCEIIFETEYETDMLVVYEEYYEYPAAGECTIVKETYELTGMDNTFTLPVSRRNDIQDEYAIYRLETDDGVIAFKVEFLLDYSEDDFKVEHGVGSAETEREKTEDGGAETEGEAYLAEHGSVDGRIEALLESIVSAAGTSSNPQDYIKSADKEYERLTEYGEYTLRYCLTEFLKGGQTDLRGHIMAQACQDIMAAMGEALLIEFEPANGQEWFDELQANAHALQEQYEDEELEKYYPVSWMLLQLEGQL